MKDGYVVRGAKLGDAKKILSLLEEWLGPSSHNRTESVADAIANQEILVAARSSSLVGLIHFVVHSDIIDGAPNAFITAFYVRELDRRAGVGTSLLEETIAAVRAKGVVSVETSTTRKAAMRFYEKRGFKQSFGDLGEQFLELDVDRSHRGEAQ